MLLRAVPQSELEKPEENLWRNDKKKMRDMRPKNAEKMKVAISVLFFQTSQQCHRLIGSKSFHIEATIYAITLLPAMCEDGSFFSLTCLPAFCTVFSCQLSRASFCILLRKNQPWF